LKENGMFVPARTFRRPASVVVGAAFMIAAAGYAPALAQPRAIAAEGLIYDLKHPDANRRQNAVHELGVAKYAPAIPDLAPLASDPDLSVRRELELALEQMEDIRVLPSLVQLGGDTDKDIRLRSVHALVNLYLVRNTGPGAALTKFGNFINPWAEELSDTVIDGDVAVDPSVVTVLRARTSDPELKIRRSASRGLGVLTAEAAIPELVAALREDRDDQVRIEAVRALRKIGDPSVGSNLLPLLNLNNDKVRNEIIGTLAKLRYQGAVAELTRLFEQSKPTDPLRALSLSALADIADPPSRSLFERFTADKNADLRLYADEGLARLADPKTQPAVTADRLVEKDARVRTAQAFALVRMGQPEYIDELIRGISRQDTRALAKEYLAETLPADRPLLFAKRDKNPIVRAELADVFGVMGDLAAVPALQEMTHDADPNVVHAAERALRRLNARQGEGAPEREAPRPPVAP